MILCRIQRCESISLREFSDAQLSLTEPSDAKLSLTQSNYTIINMSSPAM